MVKYSGKMYLLNHFEKIECVLKIENKKKLPIYKRILLIKNSLLNFWLMLKKKLCLKYLEMLDFMIFYLKDVLIQLE